MKKTVLGSQPKVCVTGGAGFIGRHVCRALVDAGWEVTALYKGSYADDPPKLPDAVRRVEWNLSYGSWAPEIDGVDAIVNLAAESHVERSIQDPVPFVRNNIELVMNVLEFARRSKPAKLVHIDTDEVFGPAPDAIFYEEWDRHIPSSPYSASKSCQAQLCTAWWRTYGVPVIIARLMNAFGFGQHEEKMVPKTVRCLLEGKPVPVHAEYKGSLIPVHGETGPFVTQWRAGSRTWLHAANIADAIRFILAEVKPLKFPDSDRPECFNISGDREVANDELVRMAAKVLGVEPKIEYQDFHAARPGHDRRYALKGTKIRERGWTPPRDFETSFRDTVLEMAKGVRG